MSFSGCRFGDTERERERDLRRSSDRWEYAPRCSHAATSQEWDEKNHCHSWATPAGKNEAFRRLEAGGRREQLTRHSQRSDAPSMDLRADRDPICHSRLIVIFLLLSIFLSIWRLKPTSPKTSSSRAVPALCMSHARFGLVRRALTVASAGLLFPRMTARFGIQSVWSPANPPLYLSATRRCITQRPVQCLALLHPHGVRGNEGMGGFREGREGRLQSHQMVKPRGHE